MAITYGMSVKEFWEEDPDLFWAYRFSFYQNARTQQEMFNQNAWLQGAYFYEAVSIALNNGFGKQKIQYSKYPYGFEEKKQTESQKKKQTDMLVERIKGRIAQVQVIKGKENKKSSTTDKGNIKGGEKINE